MSNKLPNTPEVIRNLVSDEMVLISDEIDSVPENFFQNMTSDQIEFLQKLDYCRQKLQDLSSLLKQVDDLDNAKAAAGSQIGDSLSLEYTRNKVADALGAQPLRKVS